MTKSELIQHLCQRQPHLGKDDVEATVNHIIELMAAALAKGERIEIRNFGSFCLHPRAARTARNPKTGEILLAPETVAVHFKPGKELKDRINLSREVCPIQA